MEKEQEKAQSKIELLYKGEIAYLRELKQTREKADRKKKLTLGKEHLFKRSKTCESKSDKDKIQKLEANFNEIDYLEN